MIRYTIFDSDIGKIIIAATDTGLCSLQMADGEKELLSGLKAEFTSVELVEDNISLKPYEQKILNYLSAKETKLDIPTDVKATDFQKQVWKTLQSIPYGETKTYGQVATIIDKPKAFRAVATACAKNPVALVVPCHRVIGSDGGLRGFRWGLERKKELLRREQDSAPGSLFK